MMKRMIALMLTGACLLTGCSAEIAEDTAAVQPAEINLPDLSGAGIDISEFMESADPYSEELDGMWLYDTERPLYKYRVYTSPAGALLAFDEKGRVVRYRGSQECISEPFVELTDSEVPLDVVNSFLAQTIPSDYQVTVDQAGQCVEYDREYYGFAEEIGEDGWVFGELNADGSIQALRYIYCLPEDGIRVADYDKEAMRLVKKYSTDKEGEIVERYFYLADGCVYGEYSILTGFDDAYGTYPILVRQQDVSGSTEQKTLSFGNR